MRILAHCYTYGLSAASGADKMLQSMLEYLVERGCECRAVIDNCAMPYYCNGVSVNSNRSLLGEQYDWCNIVIIHLVKLHEATLIANRFNKPVVHICHNDHVRPTAGNIVYNTHFLSKQMPLGLNSIVVHPPTEPAIPADHYRCPYVTLVNTNPNKGGDVLRQLAIQMPFMKFLGVHGGYDKNQMYQPVRNLNYRAYNAKGMDYSDTRVLIVPSKMESWSLCAAEAMSHGIPVLCSDLPGLRENCGDAAIYCSTVKDYMDALLMLRDEAKYRGRAVAGLLQFSTHKYKDELNNFYNFIENIVTMNLSKLKESCENVNAEEETKATKKKEADIIEAQKRKEKKEYKGLPTQKRVK